MLRHLSLCTALFALGMCACAQTAAGGAAVVVQPGAPGQPSRVIAPDKAHATLPPESEADVQFMQGMIMHHAQAVEMTALIPARTQNKEIQALGKRISISQTDEMKLMKMWLQARGKSMTMEMPDMSSMNMSAMTMPMMPGMLTPEQMQALRSAKGAKFDHLFLTGMIQHHEGALVMVKNLFDSPGAGQDADLFNFATDADNTQRAEIRIMQDMLQHMPKEKE